MIDIASFNRSLKATWIKRYLDKENCGRWRSFFDLEMEKIWRGSNTNWKP